MVEITRFYPKTFCMPKNLIKHGMINFIVNGGDNEIRTRDLLHAMQTRYQLRYIPIRFDYD